MLTYQDLDFKKIVEKATICVFEPKLGSPTRRPSLRSLATSLKVRFSISLLAGNWRPRNYSGEDEESKNLRMLFIWIEILPDRRKQKLNHRLSWLIIKFKSHRRLVQISAFHASLRIICDNLLFERIFMASSVPNLFAFAGSLWAIFFWLPGYNKIVADGVCFSFPNFFKTESCAAK